MIPDELKEYDFRRNLICDHDNPILIQKAWRDRFSADSHWRAGYGGIAYLSKKNSEDALTWNVFRTLHSYGTEGNALISRVIKSDNIESILFWGCDVTQQSDKQQLLNILIRTIDGRYQGTMTEPDLVIITKSDVLFCECKLNNNGTTSPWKAQGDGAIKRMNGYVTLGFTELNDINNWQPVYQLIRQYVYAKKMAGFLGLKARVLPIINADHKSIFAQYYSILQDSPMNENNIFGNFLTWQDISAQISDSGISGGTIIISKIYQAIDSSKRKK
jgi:hypothetical protein